MDIIDFHAHCYPEAVWPKVASAIKRAYDADAAHDGTVDALREAMRRAGIGLSVVNPVANRPEHVRSVNDWASGVHELYDDLIFFAAMHPGVGDPYAETAALAENGFRGVKMQPNAGCYYPNTKECFRIYEAMQENDMILVTHAGDEVKSFEPLYAHPGNFREVLESFPDLTVVLAHLGGYNTWDDLDTVLGFDNVYFDTAMTCEIGAGLYRDLVDRIGIDRVLFGTDYPWYDTKIAVDYTKDILGEDSGKIFLDNPKRLLGLD